jgi:hypothetical protein
MPGYFHFPLCLLAFGEDYKERLQCIVSYCVCERARRTDSKFSKSTRNGSLDEAASFLGVTHASYNSTIVRWKEADTFVRQWETRYGKDALVRIGTVLLWEAHDNKGVSYREFSILCAINSIIGRRRSTPRRITEPSIRVRAAGFRSRKIAQSEVTSAKSSQVRMLSEHQVRYTLEQLHERKLFARARVGAKTVKYMLGVNDDELRALLLERETRHAQFRANRAKKDAEVMAAIRSARRHPFAKVQKAVVSLPSRSRHGDDMIPDTVPDINSCSSNNGSLNNSRKNKAPLSDESGVIVSLRKEKPKRLDRSQFTKEELVFIDLYHGICLPTSVGFLPITTRSEELDKVMEIFAAGFDEKEWTENFREAVKHRREVFKTNPCKYNTLVQICWKLNY